MTANRGLALFRFFFAALCLLALVVQYTSNALTIENYRSLNFFSFFTVESNILATATFAVGGWYAWQGTNSRWLELLRGAAVMYMTVTGITYSLLLSDIEVDTAIGWVNVVLHYTMPTVIVIDWLVDLPRTRISLKESLIWLAFPLAYLVYSLIRGPIADWYPYPFLDPRISGYGQVAVMSLVIAVLAFALAVIIALSTKLQNNVPHPATAPATGRRKVMSEKP